MSWLAHVAASARNQHVGTELVAPRLLDEIRISAFDDGPSPVPHEFEKLLWRTSSSDVSNTETSNNGADDSVDVGCLAGAENNFGDMMDLSDRQAAGFGPAQVAVVLFLLVALVGSLRYITKAEVLAWTRWVQHHQVGGIVAFVAVYSVCLVMLLPAAALSLLGGALFGMYRGILVVWLGNVIGQTLAFLLARFVFRDVVRYHLERRWKKASQFDAAVQASGWKMVVVLRLSPIVPHVITNYVLGVTKLGLWTYSWSSALSVLPYVVVFVYVGCLTKNVLEIVDGKWAASDALASWGMFSAVLVVVLLVWGYSFMKKAMHDVLLETVTPGEGTAAANAAERPHVGNARQQLAAYRAA